MACHVGASNTASCDNSFDTFFRRGSSCTQECVFTSSRCRDKLRSVSPCKQVMEKRTVNVYGDCPGPTVCDTCYRNVEQTKYCKELVTPRTCQTCTRTVDKYCVRDVYEEKPVEDKKTPAIAMTIPVPCTIQIQDGKVHGTIDSSGELTGTYKGAEENAPKHTYVRYFIRAVH